MHGSDVFVCLPFCFLFPLAAESTYRFAVDGDFITKDQTAKMLEMEDGDQIDAVVEQEYVMSR